MIKFISHHTNQINSLENVNSIYEGMPIMVMILLLFIITNSQNICVSYKLWLFQEQILIILKMYETLSMLKANTSPRF